ncbi:MAG: hypothetical protein Q7V05_04385, partial [Methanoregula sp.]|nr:hypothetical protein [Methanoregula sp.]
MREKKSRKGLIPVLCTVVLILLAATTFSCGCVNKMLSKSTDDSGQVADSSPQSATGMGGPAALPDATTGSVYRVPIAEITPVKSEVVTEVAPVLTPDPYPILHGIRINNTPQYNRLDRGVEYEKTFHLSGNATGLLVNVVEGPLYIIYEVTPKFDCMASPGSCRGNLKSPVTRPYMTIIVRDNQTREIVAENGYAREFSSDTGNYEFSIASKDDAGSTTTTTSTPGPRYIAIYKEGVFHITIEGNYLDVTVKILTGALPSKLDIET